jgi:hypothetical protein
MTTQARMDRSDPCIQERNLYENHRVFHPDGNFMFFAKRKKINSYLNKNLAKIIAEVNGVMDIQLTFEPKGKGSVSEFYKIPKKNVCVVSGIPNQLSRHHIVPEIFLIHFPDNIKKHNSHDIVLIDHELHHKYEFKYAKKLINQLARRYGAMTIGEFNNLHTEKIRPIKIAYLLLKHAEDLPDRVYRSQVSQFKELTGLEATEENLMLYKNKKRTQAKEYGAYFVNFIPDIKEFCKEWRQHFIDSMNPQFMPDKWSVEGCYVELND